MTFSKLQYRHVEPTSHLMSMLYKATTWHCDAWLMLATDGSLLLHVETRAGGRELLSARVWRVHLDDTLLALGTTEGELAMRGATRVSLHSRAMLSRYAQINALHWREIRPMLCDGPLPRGFRGRSVVFHYAAAGVDAFPQSERVVKSLPTIGTRVTGVVG